MCEIHKKKKKDEENARLHEMKRKMKTRQAESAPVRRSKPKEGSNSKITSSVLFQNTQANEGYAMLSQSWNQRLRNQNVLRVVECILIYT